LNGRRARARDPRHARRRTGGLAAPVRAAGVV